jgi:pyruvate ferredoxin oxidoreductase delta subunit
LVEKGWKQIPIGGLILEAGNAERYETGTWRSVRPVIDMEKCNDCLICWVYCPDAAIIVEDSKLKDVDLYHCKGCGICAQECPKKAITMVDEIEARKEAR